MNELTGKLQADAALIHEFVTTPDENGNEVVYSRAAANLLLTLTATVHGVLGDLDVNNPREAFVLHAIMDAIGTISGFADTLLWTRDGEPQRPGLTKDTLLTPEEQLAAMLAGEDAPSLN